MNEAPVAEGLGPVTEKIRSSVGDGFVFLTDSLFAGWVMLEIISPLWTPVCSSVKWG